MDMAEGGAAPTTVRLGPEDSSSASEVAIHLLAAASSSSSLSLTVLAPASWLSRVPYFATRLKEPWCQTSPSSQQQVIVLECTSRSSPAAYLRCLHLLDGGHPRMLANVAEILELLPVADHLLFQECWDACMESLAALPWSFDEEDAIRATLAVLNLKPSCDVCERLDTAQDLASLETMLRHMVSVTAMEGALSALSQKYLKVSPAPIKEAFHSLMLKMQRSYLCQTPFLPREWYVLTKLLLQFTDAHEVVDQLLHSQELFSSLLHITNMKDGRHIINEVFEKVLSRVVPLSNTQRALLLARSSSIYNATNFEAMRKRLAETFPQSYLVRDLVKGNQELSSIYNDTNFEAMRKRLAETLPLSYLVRMDLVKGNQELSFEWFDHLFHRIDQWDVQQVEALCHGNNGERV